MSDLTIYLGNKNYSSWSLRGWLALKATGQAFDEVVIGLFTPDSKETLLKYSPSGKVPAIKHGDTVVWDSLAIGEYLAEAFPDAGLWPDDPAARATARSVAAEMHSGFMAMRTELPLNMRRTYHKHAYSREAQADINRITAIWRDCHNRFADGGSYLFGKPTLADIAFAPVASRLRTYNIELDDADAAYVAALEELPGMKEWAQAARNEPMVVEKFEFD